MQDPVVQDPTAYKNFEAAKDAFEDAARESGIELEWKEITQKHPNTIVADCTGLILIVLGLLVPGAALAGVAVRVFLALSGL